MKKFYSLIFSILLAGGIFLGTTPLTAQNSYADGNVAKIGDTEYATLADAYEAVESGQTIQLLQNIDIGTTPFESTKTYTLDLNSFTLKGSTISYQGIIRVDGGTLTITDTSESQSGMILNDSRNNSLVIRVGNARMNLEAGTIKAIGGGNTSSRAIDETHVRGSLYINGGTVIGENAKTVDCNTENAYINGGRFSDDEGNKKGFKMPACNTLVKDGDYYVLKATSHNYGDWEYIDDDYHQKICANEASHVVTEEHSWDAGKVTKAATVNAAGVKTYTCTVCGVTKTQSIAKLKPKEMLNKKLPRPTIRKPSRAKKAAVVRWKKLSRKNQKKVQGIEVQIATNKGFSKNVMLKKAKKNRTSLKIRKLKSKKTYYVRVRTYKNVKGVKQYSRWSKVRKVRTR